MFMACALCKCLQKWVRQKVLVCPSQSVKLGVKLGIRMIVSQEETEYMNVSSQLLALTPILLYTGPIFGCFILSQILYQFTSILLIICQNVNDTFYTLCLVSISFWPSKYRFKLNGDLPNTYTGLQEIHLVSMHWKHLDLTELTTLRSNLLAVISPSFSAGMC